MKFSTTALAFFLLSFDGGVAGFSITPGSCSSRASLSLSAEVTAEKASTTDSDKGTQGPLLIRAALGQKTERTPVWMMRQAGRHIKEYRELCKEYPTFRQRSEIPDVAVEVSLQPWRNYQTDGCILFSDILTPLPGMGAEFTIDEKLGPIMEAPIRSYDDMKQVRIIYYYFIIRRYNNNMKERERERVAGSATWQQLRLRFGFVACFV